MDKCEKNLHNHSQTFTDIRGPKVRKMFKISTKLTSNKSYGQKVGRQEEPWEDYSYLNQFYPIILQTMVEAQTHDITPPCPTFDHFLKNISFLNVFEFR